MSVDRQVMAIVTMADMAVERALHALPYIAAGIAGICVVWAILRARGRHKC